MKWLPEVIAVIKFAMDLLRDNTRIKDLQNEHKINLYQALKMAKSEGMKEHERVKEKGPEHMADDTDSML